MRAPQTHLSCAASHARQPNLSSALLVLPAGLARMRHRENRRDREFMLGNSRTKLPVRCVLGRRGEFEGLANWVSVLPLWASLTVLPVLLPGVCRKPQQAASYPGDSSAQSREARRVSVSVPQRPVGGRSVQRRESLLDKTDKGDEATGRSLVLAPRHYPATGWC